MQKYYTNSKTDSHSFVKKRTKIDTVTLKYKWIENGSSWSARDQTYDFVLICMSKMKCKIWIGIEENWRTSLKTTMQYHAMSVIPNSYYHFPEKNPGKFYQRNAEWLL